MVTEPGDDVTGVDATERLRRRRLRSQLLSGPPADSPEAVVDHLLAVQAQDGRGFRLAVRSRSRGLTAGDVDAALDDGRLLVTWLNRGTLHLVRSEDYWWLHRLTAHRVLPGVERRLRQLGVGVDEEERGVRVIVEALESDGPLTRHHLQDRLDAEGVTTEGQALVYLLGVAGRRGHVVRGPMADGHHAFVSVERWLGSPPADPDRAEDLDRLVRRYLAGHAPAGPEDLAKWAGITLGDARLAFAGAAGDLRATDDGSLLGLRWPGTPAPGPPRLLGPFDPVLHGWVSREPFVGAHRSVVTSNGVFRAACLVGGRVVGTWTQPSKGVVIDLLEDVDASAREVLATEARDVARFFGRGGCPVTFTGRTGGPVG
jgi:hypothetical protein